MKQQEETICIALIQALIYEKLLKAKEKLQQPDLGLNASNEEKVFIYLEGTQEKMGRITMMCTGFMFRVLFEPKF